MSYYLVSLLFFDPLKFLILVEYLHLIPVKYNSQEAADFHTFNFIYSSSTILCSVFLILFSCRHAHYTF